MSQTSRSHVQIPARPAKPKPTTTSGTKGLTGFGIKLHQAIAELPSPFDATELEKRLNDPAVPARRIGDTLKYWARVGRLKLVAAGRPGYPSKYSLPGATRQPAPSAPKTVTPASPPPDTRASLNQKLADACKQRDHARANGRDSMVEIFQADIDRLETQLDALK